MTQRALLFQFQECTLNEKIVGGILPDVRLSRFDGEVRMRVVRFVDRVTASVLTRVRSAQTRMNVVDHRNVLVGDRRILSFLIGRCQRWTRTRDEIVTEERRVQTRVRIVVLQETSIVLKKLRITFDTRVSFDGRTKIVARRLGFSERKIVFGQRSRATDVDQPANDQEDQDQTVDQWQENPVQGDQRKESERLRMFRRVEDEIIGEDQRERAAENQGHVRVLGDQQIPSAVDIQRVVLLEQTIIANEILQDADRDDKQMEGTEVDQNLLHECQRKRIESDRRGVQQIRIEMFQKKNDRVDDRERHVRERIRSNPIAMQTIVEQRFRRKDHRTRLLSISRRDTISIGRRREPFLLDIAQTFAFHFLSKRQEKDEGVFDQNPTENDKFNLLRHRQTLRQGLLRERTQLRRLTIQFHSMGLREPGRYK